MKKNYGILIGLAALLVIAVFVNVRVNQGGRATPAPTLSADMQGDALTGALSASGGEPAYFETFREDRENTREKELSYLETIILHANTDAETLQDAQQQKLALIDGMEKEFTVESLLKSKGFEDAAVTFHAGSVNVIVKAAALSEQEAAQILDIVCRETGEQAKNIKITTLQ